MAWTPPTNVVFDEVLQASRWNQQVAGNLYETCPATATAAGDLVYADGANSMGGLLAIGASGSLLTSDGSAPVWRTPTEVGTNTSGTDNGTYGGEGTYLLLTETAWGFNSGDVAITTSVGNRAIVVYSATLQLTTETGAIALGFDVSGASTVAAADRRSVRWGGTVVNHLTGVNLVVGLTPGTHTFTLAGKRTAANVATISRPSLLVVPL